MIPNQNINNKKTYFLIKHSYYKIPSRTMLSTAYKTSKRIFNQTLHSELKRPLAAVAAKSKIDKTYEERLNKEFLKTVVNNHTQFVTDFNLIYENPKDIRLYSIASLHTKPVETSHNISNDQNYSFENKTQQIQFHESAKLIVKNLHIIKNSKIYFDNPTIKSKIENTMEYKVLFNKVIEELKAKAIKFKVAGRPEEFEQTGFNILTKINPPQDKNSLLEMLPFKNDKN